MPTIFYQIFRKMCINSETRFDFLKDLVSGIPDLQGDMDVNVDSTFGSNSGEPLSPSPVTTSSDSGPPPPSQTTSTSLMTPEAQDQSSSSSLSTSKTAAAESLIMWDSSLSKTISTAKASTSPVQTEPRCSTAAAIENSDSNSILNSLLSGGPSIKTRLTYQNQDDSSIKGQHNLLSTNTGRKR